MITPFSHNNCLPDCSLGENNGLFSEEANETQEVSTHTHYTIHCVVVLSA